MDPFAEPPPQEPPKPVEPPEPQEPKREDPKPAKQTDPTHVPPSLHMRPLPYVHKRPAKPNYQGAPFRDEPKPEVETTTDLDDESDAAPRYPRSFIERPLVLPAGIAQGSIGSRVGRESSGDVHLLYLQGYANGTIGLGGFDLYGGMTINITHDDDLPGEASIDLPFFATVYAGGDIELTSNTLLGLQGVVGSVDKRRRYSPSVFIRHKRQFSERNAIYLEGDVDYNYANERADGMDIGTERFGAYAGLTGRTQPTTLFAIQLSAMLAYFKYVDDYHPQQDTFSVLSGSFALLFSVSERADFSPYVSLSTADEFDSTAIGVTVTMR